MAESAPSEDSFAPPADPIEFFTAPPSEAVMVRAEAVGFDDIGELFDRVFSILPGVIERSGVDLAGAPYALYTRMADDGADFDVEVGFPVTGFLGADIETSGLVVAAGSLPGGSLARLTHFGGYEGLPQTWERFVNGIREASRELGGPVWETYLSNPAETEDSSQLRTDLFAVVSP